MEKLYENDKFVLRKSDDDKWIYLHVKEKGKEIQPKGYVIGFNALDISLLKPLTPYPLEDEDCYGRVRSK